MRIGIVSDIHGNAAGLRCALDRMGDVDILLCAGDVVDEFRFDNATVAILKERDAICVLGNHDLGILGVHGARARSAAHVDHTLLEWLAGRPTSIELRVDGHDLLMTHASPVAPHTQYVWPLSADLRKIGEVAADYVVIGHTHRQLVERVGRPLVINPGSAGEARDHSNGRQLSYAVLDPANGDVTIDNYLVGAPVAPGA
jgi:putative phosphoesterase